MRLGFYYHIAGRRTRTGIYTQGPIGVFLDGIANQVDELVCFMHSLDTSDDDNEDYKINSKNISFVWMGVKTPFYSRIFNSKNILSRIYHEVDACDALLIRAPSPLAPYFYSSFRKITPVFYLIIGDYSQVASNIKLPKWKKNIVKQFLLFNHRKLLAVLPFCPVFVNSGVLYDEYKQICSTLVKVKTTTLTQSDFFFREDTCLNEEIHILYTGRLDFAKGLKELIEAMSLLMIELSNVSLHIVGWELEQNGLVEGGLKRLVDKLNLSDHIHFYGKLKLGEELNAMYRMADIFILPSYNEGFPRVIWEAMANSLPVIATKVGGIPDNLVNEHDALLIEAKSSGEIVKAVKRIINEEELRKKLIYNAYQKANVNTSELQSKILVDHISSSLNTEIQIV